MRGFEWGATDCLFNLFASSSHPLAVCIDAFSHVDVKFESVYYIRISYSIEHEGGTRQKNEKKTKE